MRFLRDLFHRNKTVIYTDMSCDDNSIGIAAVAFRNNRFIGQITSNHTGNKSAVRNEASAIMLGFKKFHKSKNKTIIYTDCKNLVDMLSGKKSFKHKNIFMKYIKCGELEIKWIKGHDKSQENILADFLANCARLKLTNNL